MLQKVSLAGEQQFGVLTSSSNVLPDIKFVRVTILGL
jgi:hypothetical protein